MLEAVLAGLLTQVALLVLSDVIRWLQGQLLSPT